MGGKVDARTWVARRGDRTWDSRVTPYPTRPTRLLTVVAGPHDGHPCVLYTVYGGPQAPQEPGDPGCKDKAASQAFWKDHALAFSTGASGRS